MTTPDKTITVELTPEQILHALAKKFGLRVTIERDLAPTAEVQDTMPVPVEPQMVPMPPTLAMPSPAVLYRTEDAAKFLGLKPQRLKYLRFKGEGGPRFINTAPSEVRYREEDLIEWAAHNSAGENRAKPASRKTRSKE